MSDRKPPIRFPAPVMGPALYAPGPRSTLRLSTVLKRMRAAGLEKEAAELVADHLAAGDRCPEHGPLPDPILFILNGRVAFVCPYCSGDELRLAWEEEGRREADA